MFRSSLSALRDLREYITPVSHKSSFQTTGEITPEEFIQAGDYLVAKFPTWSWGSASEGKRRTFLPENKQFLVTRHVPSHQRAAALSGDSIVESLSEDGEWVIGAAPRAEFPAVEAEMDLEDLEEPELEDSAAVPPTSDSPGATGAERSYNVYITYSTSYRVPKIYLSGFDADGAPLPPRAMFEDIIGDYKDKTVTIEQAPFQDKLTLISIHPCRHASVMRLMLNKADERTLKAAEDIREPASPKPAPARPSDTDESQSGDEHEDEWEEVPVGLRVDQYLIIFLKFMASVTPTIEHDFTMSAL